MFIQEEYLLLKYVGLFQKVEEWESEKTEADMEHYVWDNNVSRTNILNVLSWPDPSDSSKDSSSIPHIQEYKEAVTNLWNEGRFDSFTEMKMNVEAYTMRCKIEVLY